MYTMMYCVESANAVSIEGSYDKRPGANCQRRRNTRLAGAYSTPLVITPGRRVMTRGGPRRGDAFTALWQTKAPSAMGPGLLIVGWDFKTEGPDLAF